MSREEHATSGPNAGWRLWVLPPLRVIHYAVLGYGCVGWVVPDDGWLVFYLVFLPACALQWRLNRDTCILNNVETWLVTGRWRAPEANPEEGGFIPAVVERVFGHRLDAAGTARLTYGLMALFGLLAAVHLVLRA